MYKEFISPILDQLDSETWHVRAREALHYAEISPLTLQLLELFADQHHRFADERLKVQLGGIEFENPLVIGAGWDKVGRSVRAWHQLGFAGSEIGSVLAYGQTGNDKPRQFILGPGVALNRLGFNAPPAEVVVENLKRYQGSGIPIGISIGKNKDVEPLDAPEAHAVVARNFYPHAVYFTINVSSPNTPGLRALQDKGPLTDIIQAVNAVMDNMGERKPLFIKIAPDLANEAVEDVIQVVLDNDATGIIATNTTIRPDLKAKYGERWRDEAGGLSGDDEDFRRMATEKVAHIYRETAGKMDIIGVGGVKDAKTALEKMQAGAKVVQIVTGIRGEGPALPGRINRGLVHYLDQNSITHLSDIVGSEARKY